MSIFLTTFFAATRLGQAVRRVGVSDVIPRAAIATKTNPAMPPLEGNVNV